MEKEMRILLASLILLSACAEKKKTDAAPSCQIYWLASQIVYPDGSNKKSETLYCDDGFFTVNSLTGDGSTFRTAHPICLNCN
jgi:hypothetical protein